MISIVLLSVSFLAIYQASAQECEPQIYPGFTYDASSRKTEEVTMSAHKTVANAENMKTCVQYCRDLPYCSAVDYFEKATTVGQLESTADVKCRLLRNGVANPSESVLKLRPMTGATHVRVRCPAPSTRLPTQPGAVCGTRDQHYPLDQFLGFINDGEANQYSWPWMALINAKNEKNEDVTFTGVLLQPNPKFLFSDIVLTAATHVIDRNTLEDRVQKLDMNKIQTMEVVMGKHDIKNTHFDQWTQARSVVDAEFLEGFKYKPDGTTYNDIALLKLSSPIKFSDTIRPIKLTKWKSPDPFGKQCAFVGWSCPGNAERQPIYQYKVKLSDNCATKWGRATAETSVCTDESVNQNQECTNRPAGIPFLCKEPDETWRVYAITNNGHVQPRPKFEGLITMSHLNNKEIRDELKLAMVRLSALLNNQLMNDGDIRTLMDHDLGHMLEGQSKDRINKLLHYVYAN